MEAAHRSHPEAADILLQHGADPNKQDHVRCSLTLCIHIMCACGLCVIKVHWSALLAAVYQDCDAIVGMLIEAEADPHLQDLVYYIHTI